MKILLFDMDGVLLQPLGYHKALRETVRRLSLALGMEEVTLSEEHIAAFEAGGIISEWDEAAICAARLLELAWKREPTLTLPDSLADSATRTQPKTTRSKDKKSLTPDIGYTKICSSGAPNFFALAQVLSAPELLPLHPLERSERYFLGSNHHTPAQEKTLRDLLHQAHLPSGAITFRTFQELAVGSLEFTRTYGLPAVLDSDSYLLKYDRPNLSPAGTDRLKEWLSIPDHAAAIFTSRPSRAPAGIYCPSEAEIGRVAINLEELPIAGWGGMYWLAEQRGVNSRIYLKPSPVHALTALRQALGVPAETALPAAADLVVNGQADSGWQRLNGAQICVYEDTPGGIKSLKAAKEVLEKAGIRIEANYVGVAQHPVKLEALKANGARVFPSLEKALDNPE